MSQFDHYKFQLVYPNVEHHPVRNLHYKTLQTAFATFDHLVLKREKGVKHWTHTPMCLNLEYTVQSEMSQAQKAT